LIMGAGVAGLAAIGMAKGMGAIVRAFDARSVVKEQVESLGAEFLEVDYKEEGAGVGGYAKEMSADYQLAQTRMIQKQAQEVDVIITTALIPGKKAPILITKETVALMKPNSVIVDLAAEMGGNCELTQPGKVYSDPDTKVTIIGYTDIPSRMAQQSSELFAVNMLNLFEELCNIPKNPKNSAENFGIDLEDEIVKGLTVLHKGAILYATTSTVPSIPSSQPSQINLVINTNQSLLIKPMEVKLELHDFGNSDPHEMLNGKKAPARSRGDPLKETMVTALILVIGFIVLGGLTSGQYALLTSIFIFILSIFIGYMVIWNVTPSLHTPLMSVTNAISGIIIVGCMYELNSVAYFSGASFLGFIGVMFASINIFGGFIVTQRMLNMFAPKDDLLKDEEMM